MSERFARTELLLGKEAMERLATARVAVFGLGGVGGYAVEALVRSGIGAIDLIDNDRIAMSNINRQIIALESTVGTLKTEAFARRIGEIAPECKVTIHNVFFTPATSGEFDFTLYDYVVDAIDTVTGKIELAVKADAAGVPIISAMGAGNKLDPTRFEVADIYATSVCPLAKVMRRELRARGVKKMKVVYSKEEPSLPAQKGPTEPYVQGQPYAKQTPGSCAFVPSVVGLIIAGEVVKDIAGIVSI